MTVILMVSIVSGALILGAVWGTYGPLHPRVEGGLLAMAGGALIVALMFDMILPATQMAPLPLALGAVAVGAAVFTGLDYLIDEIFEAESGGGLLVAVTLDGIPENLALGVALIGGNAEGALALAAAIFLSNLPEAAGSARQMKLRGLNPGRAIWVWSVTALILGLSAVIGYLLLENTGDRTLAICRSFAAGAVVASLATEIFPRAFKVGRHMTGIAVAAGLILATLLGQYHSV